MKFLHTILNAFNTSDDAEDTHSSAMKKASISLAIFAFISVFFVAMTDHLTADRIAENQEKLLLRALNEIAPNDSYDNDLIASKAILNQAGSGFIGDTPVYLATKSGKPATAIFEVTTNKGYSGAITMLVGIDAMKKTVSGVRVVKHKETPGLGDKMEIPKTPPNKTPWVLDFDGKSLKNPELSRWNVKKDNGDFDQFTGATITPRAIVNIVKTTLLYAQDNMDALFSIGTEAQSISTNLTKDKETN